MSKYNLYEELSLDPALSPEQAEKHSFDKELALLIVKAIVGTIMLCVGFANIFNLMGWSEQYNQAVVFFVFFVWMSVGGMLFWGGIKGLWGKVKDRT